MLQILAVSGDSLAPDYDDGDFVVILKIPIVLGQPLGWGPFRLRPGDAVVFHRAAQRLIKTIDHLGPGPDELFVLGRHPLSVDSRQFGPLRRTEVDGKVILHVRRTEAAA
jgi:hypothetical protein